MDSIGTGLAVMASILAIMVVISLVIAIVEYVFGSIGLYSIIKRRGLKYPGFAWVPLLREYSMGKISDDARLKAGAQKSCLRKWILALSIATYVFMFIMGIISGIVLKMNFKLGATSGGSAPAWVIIVYCLVLSVLIAYSVLVYIAMFNIFRSCTDSYIVFTVLSIVISVTYPFFIFAARKKDREFRI